jgi:hypothetical protein
MHIVSRKARAAGVADSWYRTYCKRGAWNEGSLIHGRTKQQVYEALVKLGEAPDPDDVNATIGNGSWTDITCDECNRACEEAIEVGQTQDYESNTATLCKDCVLEAMFKMV